MTANQIKPVGQATTLTSPRKRISTEVEAAWRRRRPVRQKGSTASAGAGTGAVPAAGPAHHYHFVALALDTRLGLAAGVTKPDLESRTRGHVPGKGELAATYQRP